MTARGRAAAQPAPLLSPSVHFVDAGPAPQRAREDPPRSERALRLNLEAFHAAMVGIVSESDLDRVLQRLVTLVGWFTAADSAALEVVGLAPSRDERIVAHLGLSAVDAVAALAAPDPVGDVAPRLGHHLVQRLEHDGDPIGRMVLWRRRVPFNETDQMAAAALSSMVGLGIDKTLRRGAEQQRQRWLTAVADITDLLVANRSMPEVMQAIARHARAVSGCDLTWVVTGSDPDQLVLQAAAGRDSSVAELRRLDLSRSLNATVVRSGRILQVAEAGSWVTADGRTVSGIGVVMPVVVGSRVEGTVGLAWDPSRGYEYRTLDPDLPISFTEQAALAMRLARSRRDAERITLLEERVRIGLDLHDRAIQRLYALGMTLDAARRRNRGDPDGEVLAHAVDEVDEAIGEIRRTIAGLGVPEDQMDLYDALARLVERSRGFETELRVRGLASGAVPAPIASDLLAVTGEALSNVARHADATRCRVTVDLGDRLALTVDDDGRGFGDEVVGSGLANIRRRAEAHGGILRLSRRTPGIRLEWVVPLPAGEG